jgi:uncharacterized small protein (DUF1192 family)
MIDLEKIKAQKRNTVWGVVGCPGCSGTRATIHEQDKNIAALVAEVEKLKATNLDLFETTVEWANKFALMQVERDRLAAEVKYLTEEKEEQEDAQTHYGNRL